MWGGGSLGITIAGLSDVDTGGEGVGEGGGEVEGKKEGGGGVRDHHCSSCRCGYWR